MKKLNLLFTIPFLICSCVFIRTDDSIDLGNNYRFIQDAPQVIIYHKTSDHEGVGVEIIPPLMKSYSFNERYIIAETKEVDEMTGIEKGTPNQYWIIDKTKAGEPVKPLDSLSFYLELNEKAIDLNLN